MVGLTGFCSGGMALISSWGQVDCACMPAGSWRLLTHGTVEARRHVGGCGFDLNCTALAAVSPLQCAVVSCGV
jgi:hypothetical protein